MSNLLTIKYSVHFHSPLLFSNILFSLSLYLSLIPSHSHCQVGISSEEHERVVETIVKNEIATRDAVKESLEANSYDYVSATYLLLAEQV